MGEAERRHYAEAAHQLADALDAARAERDRRRAAGQDTAWLDDVLCELEPLIEQLVEQVHDVDVLAAIRAVVERHGSGPWPAEDLATVAGVDPAAALRVLEQVARAGLVEPPEAPQ